MYDEFLIRNQIIDLTYKLLNKHPDKFIKLDDNTVSCFVDVSSKLDLQSKINGRLIQIKITRKEDVNNQYLYSLNVIGSGDIYFKYEIDVLDSKTAVKFFNTSEMETKQQKDFELIRDNLISLIGE